jgi:hypothetical protein
VVPGFTREELLGKVIRGERGDDPVPYYVGIVTRVDRAGPGHWRYTAESAAVLVVDRELPFELPMSEAVRNRDGFSFWWKQLDYIFELDDPRTFPALQVDLGDGTAAVKRYIETANHLADTDALSALDRGFFVRLEDGTGCESEVNADFGRKDSQLGLSGLLRHCDSRAVKDGARFRRIHELLVSAAEQTADATVRAEQLRQLEAWRVSIELLHSRSVDQCVRDRLVAENGWSAFDYREHYRPDYLIRVYDYGDLLHWGEQTEELAELEADEFLAAYNRFGFFYAAAGLAHLYIGFGELARAAVPAAV